MTFPDFELRAISKACGTYQSAIQKHPPPPGAPEPAEGEQLEFDFEPKGGQRQDEREPSCTKGASRQS